MSFGRLVVMLVVLFLLGGCSSAEGLARGTPHDEGEEAFLTVLAELVNNGFDDFLRQGHESSDAVEIHRGVGSSGEVGSVVLTPNKCVPLADAAATAYVREAGVHQDNGFLFTGLDFKGILVPASNRCVARVVVNHENVEARDFIDIQVRELVMGIAKREDLHGIHSGKEFRVLRPSQTSGRDAGFSWAVLIEAGGSGQLLRELELQTSSTCLPMQEVSQWAEAFQVKTAAGVDMTVSKPLPGRLMFYESFTRKGCVGRIRASSI